MICALSSHTHHVTSYVMQCDMTSYHVTMTHDTCDVTLSHTPFCVVSSKEKEKKKKSKYNDLAILPSHDRFPKSNCNCLPPLLWVVSPC